jgi:hypothetical protein
VNDAPDFPPEMKDDKAEKDKERGPSQATVTLELLLERYRPLLGDDGQPYAVAKLGANIALPLRGNGGVRTQAAKLYADRCKGAAPAGSALTDALTVFAGHAEGCDPEAIHIRIARHGDGVVIDQGTADGRCIVIDPSGWRLESRSPVLFRRTRLSAPMPDPYQEGALDKLRRLINVDDEDWQLIVGFLLAAWIEDIPHPILGLFGLQGTAKSNATRMLVDLVSPSTAPTRSCPRDIKSWVTGANAAWVTGLDNVSSIPDWLSDALCRASTGEGMVDRALYTDQDVSVIAFRRVVIINGIDTGEMAGDLAERLIRIELNPIRKRRDERELWAEYQDVRPYALGALCDLLAKVLKELPHIEVGDAPRMADFARILAALDKVQGWGTLDHYIAVAKDAQADALSPFGTALRDFALAKCANADEWRGTPSGLFDELVPKDREGKPKPTKEWPKLQTMKGRIKRDMPALSTVGVLIDLDQRGPKPARDRLVVITVSPTGSDDRTASEGKGERPSTVSPLSPTVSDLPDQGDDRGDDPAQGDSPGCPPGQQPTPRGDDPGDSPRGHIVPPAQSHDQEQRRPGDSADKGDNLLPLPSEHAEFIAPRPGVESPTRFDGDAEPDDELEDY